jgi:hypothetical protein
MKRVIRNRHTLWEPLSQRQPEAVPVGISKFLVIDGQQRLTTIALLLCAVRDVLGADDGTLRRRIQNHYLTNEGYEGIELFKLLPTQGDRDFYAPLIKGAAEKLVDSQFKKAYDFFRRRLRDQIDENKTIDPKQILDIIATRLMAVMINLSDDDDPYLIFESLNFKGSPLEQADLVRNYFLMRFPVTEQQAVYDELWLPMQNRLGSNITEFMRHFLGAEGEEVRKGDVYAAIKRLVSDVDTASVRLLMARMERLSVPYSRIATFAPEPNPELQRYFDHFRRLDFGTVYPLILALSEDYIEGQLGLAEFLECLRILHSFIIRRMIVGVPSNSLAGLFISLCKSKPDSEDPSAWLSGALARESKNRRWPTDGEFSDRWIHTPLYGNRACPVILECLEEQYEHHEAVEMDRAAITIEHIMPQTLTPEWEQMLGPNAHVIQNEWLHTIGNLTLSGYNPELSNKSFTEKCKVFALSHLEINRHFSHCHIWGSAQIHDRAAALLKTALQIWPRPVQLSEEISAVKKPAPAAFHSQCIRAVQQHLGIHLSKLSQTRYASGDGETKLICAVSGEHNESSGIPYYWFAVHRNQLKFLESSAAPWICLGCGSAESTLLLPLSLLQKEFEFMSVTHKDDRHYWHVVIQKKNSGLILRLLGAKDGPDLTGYNVAASVPQSVGS